MKTFGLDQLHYTPLQLFQLKMLQYKQNQKYKIKSN